MARLDESAWLTSSDPQRMLDNRRGMVSERKRRLVAVACCSRVRHLIVDERSWHAVTVAEQYADGLATVDELDAAAGVANSIYRDMDDPVRSRAAEAAFRSAVVGDDGLWHLDHCWADAALAIEGYTLEKTSGLGPKETQEMLEDWCEAWSGSGRTVGWTDANPDSEIASLLRCIVGNPFRPVTKNRTWLTTTVRQLAAGVYADRAFDRLPILADALQDAGCENADVLAHCRGPGPHARGCWVVDLVLGKA